MKFALFVLLAMAASAQWPSLPKKDANGPVPRAADGKPDLSGTWENDGPRTAGGFGLMPGLGFLDIRRALKPGDLQMKPAAAKLRAERFEQNSKDHPDAHCLPLHPVQLHSHPQPQKIIQTKDLIVILYEANGGQRQIFLDGRPLPGPDAQPWWYGYSIGRWEGDTLVVTTRGFRDGGWLDEQGTPASDALVLTERFRRTAYGKLDIEMTINDPKTLEKPFTFRAPHRLLDGDDLIEFICLENQNDKHIVGK